MIVHDRLPSILSVARQLKVAPNTIYQYFSKEELDTVLMYKLIHRGQTEKTANLETRKTDQISPIENIDRTTKRRAILQATIKLAKNSMKEVTLSDIIQEANVLEREFYDCYNMRILIEEIEHEISFRDRIKFKDKVGLTLRKIHDAITDYRNNNIISSIDMVAKKTGYHRDTITRSMNNYVYVRENIVSAKEYVINQIVKTGYELAIKGEVPSIERVLEITKIPPSPIVNYFNTDKLHAAMIYIFNKQDLSPPFEINLLHSNATLSSDIQNCIKLPGRVDNSFNDIPAVIRDNRERLKEAREQAINTALKLAQDDTVSTITPSIITKNTTNVTEHEFTSSISMSILAKEIAPLLSFPQRIKLDDKQGKTLRKVYQAVEDIKSEGIKPTALNVAKRAKVSRGLVFKLRSDYNYLFKEIFYESSAKTAEIIEAASAEYALNGYHRDFVKNIANSCGVIPSYIYKNFKIKELLELASS